MRKTFTTTIEESIQKDFKLSCVKNEINMNDVLEQVMQMYIDGKIDIQTEKR